MGRLYARNHRINDKISVRVPLVGEVLDDEDNYSRIVAHLVSTPYDMMVQLDDIGIDFTKIDDFDLFLLMFKGLQEIDSSIFFGDLDLHNYYPAQSEVDGELLLLNVEDNTVIDRAIHAQIADTVRHMLDVKRNEKHPGNEDARLYMIKKARKEQKSRLRKQKKGDFTQLERYVISLVNSAEFSYTYETVRDLTLTQFFTSLKQIEHKVHFDNTMFGYMMGNVKLEDIKLNDRTWIMM